MKTTNTTKAQKTDATTEALKAEIERLKEQIAANKSAPEFSAVFVDAKERSPMKWKNLSETKRHFEQKQPELLKRLCENVGTESLTSKEFHRALENLF